MNDLISVENEISKNVIPVSIQNVFFLVYAQVLKYVINSGGSCLLFVYVLANMVLGVQAVPFNQCEIGRTEDDHDDSTFLVMVTAILAVACLFGFCVGSRRDRARVREAGTLEPELKLRLNLDLPMMWKFKLMKTSERTVEFVNYNRRWLLLSSPSG